VFVLTHFVKVFFWRGHPVHRGETEWEGEEEEEMDIPESFT